MGTTTGGIDGCTPMKPCANDAQYCDYPDDMCGDGEVGTCTFKPVFCIEIYDPVCGCDNQTYGNSCKAHEAGVDVAYPGECKSMPAPCDPQNPCPDTQYCDYPDDMCGKGEQGTCKDRPQVCPLVLDPVCGCDGMTYGNNCEAASSGQDYSMKGMCP
ncbi:MAG: hypothetical protein D6705_11365 [Deltaproteobacteria bacterium]|nr:MAG: hypothetical protein D6705_11365 [Deltaproteobacteria bacterium]